MKPTESPISPSASAARAARRLVPLLAFVLLLVGALPASGAPPIKVTSAVPDTGEQGTMSLVVRVGGDNFGADSQVAFYVTGTTNPGGIVVRNVHWVNAKNLDATIDIAPDAQYQLRFDVQVMSNGRTGKGTELFKVTEKVVGSDTIPPGDVTDLAVDLASGGVGFRSVALVWTAPADDGYYVPSGPAYGFAIRGSADGALTLENWGELGGVDGEPPAAPGSPQRYLIDDLVPESTYWFAVRYQDEPQGGTGGNWSGVSNNVEVTTEPFPAVNWTIEAIDGCPAEAPGTLGNEDFEYDLDGRPAVFYFKQCGDLLTPYEPILARWNGSAWIRETLPASIGHGDRLEFDPITGEAVIASSNPNTEDRQLKGTLMLYRQRGASWAAETIDTRLAGGPPHLAFEFHDGRPFVAYPVEAKGGRVRQRLAEWTGSAWLRREVPVNARTYYPELAFDTQGHPAIAYLEWETWTLWLAQWTGAAWEIEVVDAAEAGQNCWYFPALAWNPVLDTFTVANHCGEGETERLRVCHRLTGGWSCATVMEDAGEPVLAFDDTGVLYMSVFRQWMPQLMTSLDGGWTWSDPELVDWSVCGATQLVIDPAGRPALVYMVGGYAHPGELHLAQRP